MEKAQTDSVVTSLIYRRAKVADFRYPAQKSFAGNSFRLEGDSNLLEVYLRSVLLRVRQSRVLKTLGDRQNEGIADLCLICPGRKLSNSAGYRVNQMK